MSFHGLTRVTILRLPVRFVMDCDAKPRYLGARRLSLSWTRQELCDTTDHIIQGLLLARSQMLLTTAA